MAALTSVARALVLLALVMGVTAHEGRLRRRAPVGRGVKRRLEEDGTDAPPSKRAAVDGDLLVPPGPCCICIDDDISEVEPSCALARGANFLELVSRTNARAEAALAQSSTDAIHAFRVAALDPNQPIPHLHSLRRFLTNQGSAPAPNGWVGDIHFTATYATDTTGMIDGIGMTGTHPLTFRGTRAADVPLPPATVQGNFVVYDNDFFNLDHFGRVISATFQGIDIARVNNMDGQAFSGHACDFVNAIGNLASPLPVVGQPGARAYQAGHIRSNSIGGDKSILNVVPEHPTTNGGVHGRAESLLKNALRVGGCTVNLVVLYDYEHTPLVTDKMRAANDFYKPRLIRYTATTTQAGCVAPEWHGHIGGWANAHIIDLAFPNPTIP